MDDDWHSLYPTLCRIGRVQDWVEWQVDLASALGAMQPWHCGRVDELMNACEAGAREVVHLLLVAGASVDQTRQQTSATALHTAAAEGHLAIVRDLLSSGANADLPDADGKTPTLLASLWEVSGVRE